jgi:hypothetical protein
VKRAELRPECQHGQCDTCPGPGPIYRKGAPPWEAPLMTIRCDHACHRPPARAR